MSTESIGEKVPAELKRRIRLKAAISNKNMSTLVREALEKEFEDDPQIDKLLGTLSDEELRQLVGGEPEETGD